MTTVAIDLGTCFSLVAICKDGAPEVLSNDVSSRTTPSCVLLNGSERLIGEAADGQAAVYPLSTVRNVKRVLAASQTEKYDDHFLGGVKVVRDPDTSAARLLFPGSGDTLPRTLDPETVTAMVLESLLEAAEIHLGQRPARAVITVPCYFDLAQRQAVMHAGRISGLEECHLINETSAAALKYVMDQQCNQVVLVIDVGGGGTAISVVQTSPPCHVQVLAASAHRLPGGEDFDNTMIKYLAQVIAEKYHRDFLSEPRAYEIVRALWKQAKHKLSRVPRTSVRVHLPAIDVDETVEVTRDAFEERCAEQFRTVINALDSLLVDAKVRVADVKDVVLVGGSSRIVKIRTLLEKHFAGLKLCKAVNADEGVVCGAALYAAALSGEYPFAQQVALSDVNTQDMAVTHGGHPLCTMVRNRKLPYKITRRTTRGRSHHSVFLTLEVEQTKFVLNSQFTDPIREEFDLTVHLDCDGIVSISTNSAPVHSKLDICLDEETVQALRAEGERLRNNELELRARLEAKNAFETVCREILAMKDKTYAGKLLSNARAGLDWLSKNHEATKDDCDKRCRQMQEAQLLHVNKQRKAAERVEKMKQNNATVSKMAAQSSEHSKHDSYSKAEENKIDMIQDSQNSNVGFHTMSSQIKPEPGNGWISRGFQSAWGFLRAIFLKQDKKLSTEMIV